MSFIWTKQERNNMIWGEKWGWKMEEGNYDFPLFGWSENRKEIKFKNKVDGIFYPSSPSFFSSN